MREAENRRYTEDQLKKQIAERTRELNQGKIDAGKAEILDMYRGGPHVVLKVQYPNCKKCSYEGVKILVGSATVTPTGASVANGAWVQVTGTVGGDGTIAATAIRVRQASTADDLATVRLVGAIESLTDPQSFVVRGVPVDAASATVDATCSGVTLAVGTVVNVTATAQSGTDVVLASRLACPAAAAYTMRSLSGTAGTVDVTARTFVLTTGTGTQKVQWSDQTVFACIGATALDGVALVLDGYLDATGTLIARKVRNPAAANGKQDADDYAKAGNTGTRTGSSYRSSRH